MFQLLNNISVKRRLVLGFASILLLSVSYTHLTLPTIYSV